MDLNEHVIVALRARLEAGLPAAIDQLNQAGGPVTLEPPAQVLDYPPLVSELVAFPTVGIQDLSTTFEDDIGDSVTSRVGLGVIAFVQADEQRTLAWSLRRYMRAITQVALAGRSLDGAFGTGFDRIQPGPTLEDEENPRSWVSWSALAMWARVDDG